MLNPFSGLNQQLLVFVLPTESNGVTNDNLGIVKLEFGVLECIKHVCYAAKSIDILKLHKTSCQQSVADHFTEFIKSMLWILFL